MSATKSHSNPFDALDARLARFRPKQSRKVNTVNQDTQKPESGANSPNLRPITQRDFESRMKNRVKNQGALASTVQGLTNKKYRSTVALTAQQYADLEAKKHAAVAGDMIRNCVSDMSNILNELRTKIDFAEPGELKTVTDTYAAATRELRRALGIIEQTGHNVSSALVQVQCVGQVSVSTDDLPHDMELAEPTDTLDLPDVLAEFSSPLNSA